MNEKNISNVIEGIEMSKLNDCMPRHYKGFDVDIILQKIYDGVPLSDDENQALKELDELYQKPYEDQKAIAIQKWMEENKGQYRRIVSPGKKSSKIGQSMLPRKN